MWQFVKNVLRILVPALIAIITLALPVLPTLFGDLSQGADLAFAQQETSETTTAEAMLTPTPETPTSTEEPTATITPTPTLQPAEIEPDSVTIYQQLGFSSGFGWDHAFKNPDVDEPSPTIATTPQAILSVYVNQTHASQVNIYHPPLNYENGPIEIAISQILPCNSLAIVPAASPHTPTNTPPTDSLIDTPVNTLTSSPTSKPTDTPVTMTIGAPTNTPAAVPATLTRGTPTNDVTETPIDTLTNTPTSTPTDTATHTPTHLPAVFTQPMDVNCYSLAPVGTLGPGEYNGKLFVDIADQSPQTVNVSLKVRANPWWMLILVAVGVVVTELLVNWNRRWRYNIAWRARRVGWFDLLSERLNWIFGKSYSDDSIALSTALRLAKSEIRAQVNTLRDWMKRGHNGEVKLADIPTASWQDTEMLFSLRGSIDTYIPDSNDFFNNVDYVTNLQEELATLRQRIKNFSANNLARAITQAEDLYASWDRLLPKENAPAQDQSPHYLALREFYQQGKLTNDVIKTAWEKVEAARKNGTSLKDTFENTIKSQPRVELPHMAEVCNKLADNVAKFKMEVIDLFADQRSKVDAVSATPVPDGKTDMIVLLQALDALAPRREAAELKTKMANEPLCFPSPEISETMQRIESILNEIDGKIEGLRPRNIGANATADLMLKGIREHLYSAEKNMSNVLDESTLEKTWRELSNHYLQDQRFFNLGKRILSLQGFVHSSYLLNAYRYLLDGKILEAEVELERAEKYKTNSLNDIKNGSKAEASDRKSIEQIMQPVVAQFLNFIDFVMNYLPPERFTVFTRWRARYLTDQRDERSGRLRISNFSLILMIAGVGFVIGLLIGSLARPLGLLILIGFAILFGLVAMSPRLSTWVKTGWNSLVIFIKNWKPNFYSILLAINWILAIRWFLTWIFVWRQIGWSLQTINHFIGIILVIVYLLLQTIQYTNFGKTAYLFLAEATENFWTWVSNLVANLLSQAITIAVATALVIVTYQLANRADTWGTPFDFLAAFVWGIVANRVAEPTKTGWQKLIEDLSQPKADTAADGAETGAAADAGAAGTKEEQKKETTPA